VLKQAQHRILISTRGQGFIDLTAQVHHRLQLKPGDAILVRRREIGEHTGTVE